MYKAVSGDTALMANEGVLWKQKAVCFAGSEQGQRVWALILINLSVANP